MILLRYYTYKYARGPECQGFENIGSTADPTIQEHGHTALCSFHNLRLNTSSVNELRNNRDTQMIIYS